MNFFEAMAQADDNLDAHLGERVRVVPMLASKFSASVDPDRPEFEVIALVSDDEPSLESLPSVRLRGEHEEFAVEVRRSELTLRLRQGDQIVLIEHPEQLRLKIDRTVRVDRSRMKFVCGPVN